MAKEEKTQIIEEIAGEISRSKIIVVTDYRGLTAKEMTVLRRQLRKAESGLRVVRDTLAILAARKAGREKLETLLKGPVALAYGYGDITASVKAVLDHIRAAGSALKITGGLLGDRPISKADVQAIATLPSREVLLARVAGSMKMPLQLMHNVLSSPLRGLASVLQARLKQLESAPPPAAAAAAPPAPEAPPPAAQPA